VAGASPLPRAIGAALELASKGAYEQAIRALEAGGPAVAAHPLARNLLGNIYLQQDRPREALRAFDAAAKAAPRFPEAHCNRGVVLERLGRHEEALAAYERALAIRSAYPLAQFNRANLLQLRGESDAAIAGYDAAIAGQPNFPESYHARGRAFLATGRPLDALANFDRAIAQRPAYREALLGKAQALLALHRGSETLMIAEVLLAKNPSDGDALSLKATALGSLRRFAEELAALATIIELEPGNVAARARKSGALRQLKRIEEALAAADEALGLSAASHEAHLARALALGELGRFEEGLEELQRAEELGAPSSYILTSRAVAYSRLGRLDEAGALFKELADDIVDDPAMRYNYGLYLLERGDFERGWEEHEQRLRKHDFEQRTLTEIAPQWNGDDLDGKKLLIFQEQGLGDAIQFSRYVKRLGSPGAQLSLLVQPALVQLFKASFPAVDVTDTLGLRGGFNWQVSLMSLPYVLRAQIATIPGEVPYLRAEPERIEKWRSRTAGKEFKVGLCWQGNRKLPRDRFRSIPLALFAPLSSVRGVRLISLQSIYGVDQLAELPAGMSVEALGVERGGDKDGFADAAAIMANLDLVISVDSAIAHLAGALAVPVWVAIRAESEWRWMQESRNSPWYPTMRLFRQSRLGEWSGVISEMARELEQLAAGKRESGMPAVR
jgi:tetratricopeptide (TPR) repeat protein